MIGDWVTYKTENYEPYSIETAFAQITGFNKYGSVYAEEPNCGYCQTLFCEDAFGYASRKYDKIMPIPLTAEILEKNGAEKEYEWSRYCISEPYGREIYAGLRMDGVYLYADEEDDKWNFFAHIRYVHELQHALRLCGLNDLADNFKI